MKRASKIIGLSIMVLLIAFAAVFSVGCKSSDKTYTLTFISGGEVYKTITAKADGDVTPPADPDGGEGRRFEGWSLSDNGSVVNIPAKMPAENVTYYAVYSKVYTVTLDAGDYGTLDNTVITDVKQGVNLYDLIKDIEPAAKPGVDPFFGGWFYNDTELKPTSATRMPGSNITITAKYKVEYKTYIHKQTDVGSDEYYTVDTPIIKTNWVGERVSSMPTVVDTPEINGYAYVSHPDETGIKKLSADKSKNVFDVYYNVLKYNIIYSANAPKDTKYTGTMENGVAPHDNEIDVPACGYSIAGYRFAGWAKTSDGDVEYKVGEKFSVTRTTTLYAVWDKGCIEASGESDDLLFVRASENKIYLQRNGLSEKEGIYTAATGAFRFENAHGEVVSRGRVDLTDYTFVYNGIGNTTVYRLRDKNGAITESTLELFDDGTAKYTVSGQSAVNGTYGFDTNDGALVFTPASGSDSAFYFRLSKSGSADIFDIRGNECGKYYNADSESLDSSYYIVLDGYGTLTAYASGFDNNLDNVTRAYAGKYAFAEGETDVINVAVFRDKFAKDSPTDEYTCLLMRNFGGSTENGYRKFTDEITVYATGKAGDNGNKLVLSGDGTVADYYKDGVKTYSGSYELNESDMRIELYDADKKQSVMFTLNEMSGEIYFDYYSTFEDLTFYHGYYYSYLNSYLNGGGSVLPIIYRVYPEQDAVEIRFYWLMNDSFYNIYNIDSVILVKGDYESLPEVSGIDDARYWFTATEFVNREVLDIVLMTLYSYDDANGNSVPLFGYTEDYEQFVFTMDKIVMAYDECNVYGAQVNVDGKTYTLDGFGNAVGETDSLLYVVNDYGLKVINFYSSAGGSYSSAGTYFEIDGEYLRQEQFLIIENASYDAAMSLLENDYAVLCNYTASTSTAYIGTVMAWGKYAINPNVTFKESDDTEDEGPDTGDLDISFERTFGSFKLTHVIDDRAYAVFKAYESTKFLILNEIFSLGESKVEYKAMYVYSQHIGDDNAAVTTVITVTSGDYTLELDLEAINAKLYKGDDLIGSGEVFMGYYGNPYGFYAHGDNIVIMSVTGSDTAGNYVLDPICIKLIYDAAGNIDGFVLTDGSAGTFVDYADGVGRITLSGIETEQTADSAEYSADGKTTVNGTYSYDADNDEYAFSSADNKLTFNFIITYDGDNHPVFIRALPEISYVAYEMSDDGLKVAGSFYRGPYDDVCVFEYDGKKIEGVFTYTDTQNAAVFYSADYGLIYYIYITEDEEGGFIAVLRDPVYGTYYYGNDFRVRLVLDGLGNASVVAADEYEGFTGKGAYTLRDDSGEYVIYSFVSEDESFEFEFTCGYSGNVGIYFVYDEEAYGIGSYESSALESVIFDGYGNAVYVDGYGRSHEGVVVRADNGDAEVYHFVSYAYGEAEYDLLFTLNGESFTVSAA